MTSGFTLTANDTFDILSFASLAGPGFDALSLDGAACTMGPVDWWSCGGRVRLTEAITSTTLDLVVASAPAGSPGGSGSPIPEPSTWALLAIGFLGLGGLGLRRRGSADKREQNACRDAPNESCLGRRLAL